MLLPVAWAAKVKTSAPVHITSDEASFDSKTGRAIHKGNVVMTQQGRTLHADKLEVERIQGQVKSITATGTPATFDEPDTADKPAIFGQAARIDYLPDADELELKGSAKIERSPDTFTGSHLTYSIANKSVRTNSDEKQRSTFVIGPRSN